MAAFLQPATDLERLLHCDSFLKQLKIEPKHNPERYSRSAAQQSAAFYLTRAREQWAYQNEPRLAFETVNRALCAAQNPEWRAHSFYARATFHFELCQYAVCMASLMQSHREAPGQELSAAGIRAECERMLNRRPWSMFGMQEAPRPVWLTREKFDWTVRFPRLQQTWMGALDTAVHLRQRIDGREQRVVANQALRAGQFVAIDRALFGTLSTAAVWTRCSECGNEDQFALQPCVRCNSVMFCSMPCDERAERSWHQYECDLGSFLFNNPDMRLMVRVVLSTFRSAADVAEMMHVFATTDRYETWRENNVFSLSCVGEAQAPHNHGAKLIYGLSAHPQYRRPTEPADLFWYARRSTYLFRVLQQKTEFVRSFFRTRAQRHFLRSYLFEHMMLLAVFGTRTHTLSSSVRFNGERQDRTPVAAALFPLWCTLRHSCTPNVIAMPMGMSQQVLCTVRPIAAGEELTVDRTCSLAEAENSGGQQHRNLVQKRVRIDCKCPRDESMPLPFPNRRSPTADGEIVGSVPQLQRLYREKTADVEREFDRLSDFLTENDRVYPCVELWHARRAFEQCLERLVGPPFEHDFGLDDFAVEQRAAEDAFQSRFFEEMVRQLSQAFTPKVTAAVVASTSAPQRRSLTEQSFTASGTLVRPVSAALRRLDSQEETTSGYASPRSLRGAADAAKPDDKDVWLRRSPTEQDALVLVEMVESSSSSSDSTDPKDSAKGSKPVHKELQF